MVLTFKGEQANIKFTFTIKHDHRHPPPNTSQSLILPLVSRKTKHMMKPSFIFVFYITAAKMPNKMKRMNENNLTILFSSLMYSSILSIIIWSSSFTTILVSYAKQSTGFLCLLSNTINSLDFSLSWCVKFLVKKHNIKNRITG